MVKRTLMIIRKLLVVPDILKNTIHEGFDPSLVLDDLITVSLPNFVDLILDFKGDDNAFVNMLKGKMGTTIASWIDELEEGFVNGPDNVIAFLKENVAEILKASCEPSKKMIVNMMGVPPVMKFIKESYD